MKKILAFGPIRDDVFDRNYFAATEALTRLGLTVPEKDFFRAHRGEIVCITAVTRRRCLSKKPKGTEPCDCKELTGRYACPQRFGKDHCPRHCALCAAAKCETRRKDAKMMLNYNAVMCSELRSRIDYFLARAAYERVWARGSK